MSGTLMLPKKQNEPRLASGYIFPRMQINPDNGDIRFPGGLQISPAITQDEFLSLPDSQRVRKQNDGTLPWIHYHVRGGQIEGKELLASLCFYDKLLVYVNVTADLYPPGPRDWSIYSLEIEASTKLFHDRLLEQMFGKPSKGGSILFRRLPTERETLDRPLQWEFPWGKVFSCHDFKGGGTYITVGYGNRKEEASKAYRRGSHFPAGDR